jgi:PKD repeat protein
MDKKKSATVFAVVFCLVIALCSVAWAQEAAPFVCSVVDSNGVPIESLTVPANAPFVLYSLAQGGYPPYKYYWTLLMPGGVQKTIGSKSNLSYSIPAPGQYTINLRVWDALEIFADYAVAVTVLPMNLPPVANAGPDQNVYTTATAVLQGTVMDPDGDAIASWKWTVLSAPDGAAWNLQNADMQTAQFQPLTAGDYVLSLVVADARMNYSAPDDVAIHSVDNLPPVAVATANTTDGVAPLTVCFDGSQSYDPEGGPLTYNWDLGADGAVAATLTVCHTYQTAGQYTVTFAAADVRNAMDTEVLSIAVKPPDNQPPLASPTAVPNAGPAPLTVQFAANASDPDGNPLTYAWSFGDGATSTASGPAHTYETAGSFTAELTVSDGQATAFASLTITVSPTIGLNSPPIDLNVTRANINFKSRWSALAKVELQAELNSPVPAPGDIVALYLDGAQVFSVPFSEFVVVQKNDTELPHVYMLKTRYLWVKIDFVHGRLTVDADKVLLTGFNGSNGVDVESRIGNAVAMDNFRPMDQKGERHYKHQRPERGKGHFKW